MDTTLQPQGNGRALATVAAEWTADQVALIKRTCVPAGDLPSDDAFAVYLHTCRRTGLDPILREAMLISRRSKDARGNWVTTWQTLVGRDGYLAAAHRTGEFRGIVTRVYPEDASKAPTHATCTVHRLGWQPTESSVAFAEFAQDSPTWRRMPRVMIAKVAESHALRRAFSLHGTYSPEELPPEDERPIVSVALPTMAAAPAALPTMAAAPAALPPASNGSVLAAPMDLGAATIAKPQADPQADPFADLADSAPSSATAASDTGQTISDAQRRLLYARSKARAAAVGGAVEALRDCLLQDLGVGSSTSIRMADMDRALALIAAWLPPTDERQPGEDGDADVS